PPLALVSALVLPPLVLATRFFQVRVRAAERDNRRAVGAMNTHLQETLAGVEVIRPFAREAVFVARFRIVLRATVAAYNPSTPYSAFYPPVTGMLAATATAVLLWAGTGGPLVGRGGRARRAGRAHRCGQDQPAPPGRRPLPAVVRNGPGPRGRPAHARPGRAAARDRRGAPGGAALQRDRARQRRLRGSDRPR